MTITGVLQADLFFNLTFGGIVFWSALCVIFLKENETRCEETEEGPKKVLVYGLKDPAGGVEKIVLDYARVLAKKNISFDFLLFGKDFSFEKEIEDMGCRCLYLPSKTAKAFEYKRALSKAFRDNNYAAVWGNYSGLTNIDLLIKAITSSIIVRISSGISSYCTDVCGFTMPMSMPADIA